MEDFSKYEKLNELKDSLKDALDLFDSNQSYSSSRNFYHRTRSSYHRTTGKAYPKHIKSLYHNVIEARTILAHLRHFNSLSCVSRDEIEFAEKFTAVYVEDHFSKEHDLLLEILKAEEDFEIEKITKKKRNQDLAMAFTAAAVIVLAVIYRLFQDF
uniref:Uncharacterized protein n=1 Tax=Rhizobium phage LG08 TaxID=3129229 RepID=A0AAU8HXV4_9CAUD